MEKILIRNAHIKTMAGPELENGCLLIEDGKIAAVAPVIDAPADARAGRAWIIMRSSSR